MHLPTPPNPDPPDGNPLWSKIVYKINMSMSTVFLIISLSYVVIITLVRIFTRDMTDKLTDCVNFTTRELIFNSLNYIIIDLVIFAAFYCFYLIEFYKSRIRLYKLLSCFQVFVLIFDISCLWVKSAAGLLYKLNNPLWIGSSIIFVIAILMIVIFTKNE